MMLKTVVKVFCKMYLLDEQGGVVSDVIFLSSLKISGPTSSFFSPSNPIKVDQTLIK